MLSEVAQSGGGVAFWQALLIGAIAPMLGLIAWTIRYLRTRGADKVAEQRREDAYWGYTDAQGIRHIGIIDSHTAQITNLRADNDEIHEILERNNLR